MYLQIDYLYVYLLLFQSIFFPQFLSFIFYFVSLDIFFVYRCIYQIIIIHSLVYICIFCGDFELIIYSFTYFVVSQLFIIHLYLYRLFNTFLHLSLLLYLSYPPSESTPRYQPISS